MLNIITITALRKTSSLPKNLKTLLLSLAVSDLGVGFLVHPLYVVSLVMKLKGDPTTIAFFTQKAFHFMGIILGFASFFAVTALTADRFLTLQLHLRYQELVTYKRVVSVVISIWAISAFFSILDQFYGEIMYFVKGTLSPVLFILSAFFYYKMFLAVRRHRNQIQDLQLQQQEQNVEETTTAAKLRKSMVGTFYVYLVFLACYLPYMLVNIVRTVKTTSLTDTLSYYALTLVFLNSSLNPLVYCWKMRQIRPAIRDILQNILPITDKEGPWKIER